MKHDFFNLLGKDEAEVCVYYGLGIDDYELTKVSSTDNFTKVHTRAKFTASGENYYNFVYIYVRVEVHEMNNKDSPELIMIMDLIYDHSLELRDVDYYYKLPI
jgi:hypothetical protein